MPTELLTNREWLPGELLSGSDEISEYYMLYCQSGTNVRPTCFARAAPIQACSLQASQWFRLSFPLVHGVPLLRQKSLVPGTLEEYFESIHCGGHRSSTLLLLNAKIDEQSQEEKPLPQPLHQERPSPSHAYLIYIQENRLPYWLQTRQGLLLIVATNQ